MRTSEADILLVPGLADLGPDHWLMRWKMKMSTAQVIAPDASAETWRNAIIDAVRESARPVVLVAHADGVFAAARSVPGFPPGKVKGGFFVAPAGSGLSSDGTGASRDPLPFPSALVASRNHPEAPFDEVEDLAYAWGGRLLDAGEAGAIDADSGHGPWPEGLMSFAGFMKNL